MWAIFHKTSLRMDTVNVTVKTIKQTNCWLLKYRILIGEKKTKQMKSTLTLSMSSFSILNPLTSLSRDRIFALISTNRENTKRKKKNTNQKNKLLANNIAWCYKLLFLMCAYITRGHQNVFKEQVALELAPKAQVLEGRRI